MAKEETKNYVRSKIYKNGNHEVTALNTVEALDKMIEDSDNVERQVATLGLKVGELGGKITEIDSDLNGGAIDSDIVQVTGVSKPFYFPMNLEVGKQYEITISADGVLQPKSSGDANFFPLYVNTASGVLINERNYADSKLSFTPDETFTQFCIWTRSTAFIAAGGVQFHATAKEPIKQDLGLIKEHLGDLSELKTEEKTSVVGAINEVLENSGVKDAYTKEEIDNKIGEVEAKQTSKSIADVTWKTGGIKYSDGTIISTSAAVQYTEFISVDGYEKISLTAVAHSGVYGSAFYSDTTVESYISGKVFDAASTRVEKTYIIDVPVGAKYFRTCRFVADNPNWKVVITKGKNLQAQIDELKSKTIDSAPNDGKTYAVNAGKWNNIDFIHEMKADLYGDIESEPVLISSASKGYSFPINLKAGNTYVISLSADGVLDPSSAGSTTYSPLYVNSLSTLLWEKMFADTTITFTPDSDFQKFILYVRTSSLIGSGEVRIIAKDLSSLKERVGKLESEISEDFSTLRVPTLYGRKYTKTSSFLKFNNKIYPEGFCRASKDKLTINGGREYQPLLYPIEDVSTSKITLKSGNAEKEITLQYKNVDPSSLPSTKEFVLCVGESTTASSESDNDQKQLGPWGWASSVRMFSMMDRKDNVGADIVTLGTKSGSTSRRFSYKNEDLYIKSCHEGHSGWPSYTFLHYPTIGKLSASTTRFEPKSLWYVLGLYSKTPYNQSGYNAGVEEYTGSAQQITMITSTPWGKYKMDCHQSVWTIMKALSGRTIDGRTHPIFGDTSASYTGSEQQQALMHEWNNALMNTPINPFYSINEARNGMSGTAFSLETYLSRFRTLDDKGNRLVGSAGESVVGQDGKSYTIGTDVTSTDAYDVCAPTKVILNVGINDLEGDNTEFNTFENIKTLVGRFDVPTAYFLSRQTGSCNPALWSDVADLRPYSPFGHNTRTLELLIDWFAEQGDKYLLASYAVQHPCSVTGNFNMVDPISEKTILNCKIDNLHPGINAYKSIGFQCLSWLYYVISK